MYIYTYYIDIDIASNSQYMYIYTYYIDIDIASNSQPLRAHTSAHATPCAALVGTSPGGAPTRSPCGASGLSRRS